MRFPHTLSLHDARDIHSLHCHFERSEKSFSSPFSHDSFAKPFTGSTAPTFSRYGVSRFSLPNTRPLAANEKDPSAPLGMTIREERVFHTLFLCMMHGISIPYTVISSVARNLFRPLFPTTPSLSLLGEAPSPPFLRYGVSHSLLSDTRRLAANEKDPSMTIRETCFLNTIFSRSTEIPISRLFTSLSFISRL